MHFGDNDVDGVRLAQLWVIPDLYQDISLGF